VLSDLPNQTYLPDLNNKKRREMIKVRKAREEGFIFLFCHPEPSGEGSRCVLFSFLGVGRKGHGGRPPVNIEFSVFIGFSEARGVGPRDTNSLWTSFDKLDVPLIFFNEGEA
jgi:hypothetical protein